ncbi:DNA-binding response regulator, LytR/AlgR family [Formosa sp. Hel1_31_208]|uniref:LytR/AlgR family response regulator transcription factor n=1 Tax=Formosa sp. Hel1_31_208 TaxID=1798225 RepID=UPI00087991F1|nr:LytTR family DNA-binding domain-containing protein [Formosa sp. Hel1_31_208]SDS51021.1 DNA-binding response regulator, LytR/AlgR family [Formosa sp. Hel1_31_208]
MTKNQTISCLIVDDEAIARDIISAHLSHFDTIKIIGRCANALEAFDFINKHDIDLVFLDINMPEISGISFAKSINPQIKVIFTTAYRDYAVEGFELRAVDYLLKPISFDRFEKALNSYYSLQSNRVQPQTANTNNSDFMFVRSERKMIKIDYNTIIYIESYSDYLKIHLQDSIIITRETISATEAKLPKQQFLRIHRSFIIALAHIQSFTHEHITINDIALPMSRSYKKEVLAHLEKF